MYSQEWGEIHKIKSDIFYLSEMNDQSVIEIEEQLIKGDSYYIHFPKILFNEKFGECTRGYINGDIESFVFDLIPNEKIIENQNRHPVKCYYEVKKLNNYIISIVFNGSDTYGYDFSYTLNFDFTSSYKMTFPNIIWPNAREFEALLSLKLKDKGFNNKQIEYDFNLMIDLHDFYFNKNELVLRFYNTPYPSGNGEELINIKIPLIEIIDYLNTYFGEHPIC